MNYEDIFLEAVEQMDSAIGHTVQEFSALHTGKASPGMVENIQVKVESYGSTMQLREIAAITTPDPRTIQIQPWDKSVVKDIEKAIQTANIGFNPAVAGSVIRIPVPELSGDRRRELVKVAHSIAEDSRISVRHARRDAMEGLKLLHNKGEISKDDFVRYGKDVQDETDKHITEIGQNLAKKEKELMTV